MQLLPGEEENSLIQESFNSNTIKIITEFLVSFPAIKFTLPMGRKASGVVLVLVVEDATVKFIIIICQWLLLSKTHLRSFLYIWYIYFYTLLSLHWPAAIQDTEHRWWGLCS